MNVWINKEYGLALKSWWKAWALYNPYFLFAYCSFISEAFIWIGFFGKTKMIGGSNTLEPKKFKTIEYLVQVGWNARERISDTLAFCMFYASSRFLL